MAKAIKFKDGTEKRDEIIAALEQLKDNLGWQVLKRVLEENVKAVEEKLHGNKEWEEGDTLDALQDRRNDRVEMIGLPESLINEFREVAEWPVDLDPYE